MATSGVTMTSNLELDEITAGDSTLEVTGYVDSIDSIKYVQNGTKALLKFVLNNSTGRKVRVLMWEKAAMTHESKIISKEIIRLNRVKALPVVAKFYKPEESTIPFELSFQSNSTIEFLGKFDQKEPVEPFIEIDAEECCKFMNGEKIKLSGYVKQTFFDDWTKPPNKGPVHGAIVMKRKQKIEYKVRVSVLNVVQETKIDPLLEGMHISVIGRIKPDKYPGSMYIEVKSLQDISVIDNEVLTKEQMRDGVVSPLKRSYHDDNNEENLPSEQDVSSGSMSKSKQQKFTKSAEVKKKLNTSSSSLLKDLNLN